VSGVVSGRRLGRLIRYQVTDDRVLRLLEDTDPDRMGS
jgi:hypothetical protein